LTLSISQIQPAHFENSGAIVAQLAPGERASSQARLVDAQCSVSDCLNSAVALNFPFANDNSIQIETPGSVGLLEVCDLKHFALLNGIIAYFVDNRSKCRISVSATLSESLGAHREVRFKVTASSIPLQAMRDLPRSDGSQENASRVKTGIRDVTTMANALNVPMRANLVELKKSEISFCLSACESGGGAGWETKVSSETAVAPRQEKLQILLVSCIASVTAKFIQSLHGEDFCVTKATDPTSACSTEDAVKFDLVFLDVSPGPVKVQRLFGHEGVGTGRLSRSSCIFSFNNSPSRNVQPMWSMQHVLHAVAFTGHLAGGSYDERMFEPIRSPRKYKTKKMEQKRPFAFAFSHSKLGWLLEKVNTEGFAKRAHLFADQLQSVAISFANCELGSDWQLLNSKLRKLADFSEMFGANNIHDLCRDLTATLQRGEMADVVRMSLALPDKCRVARSQLLALVSLIGVASTIEFKMANDHFD
jgi:hypothetical protein